MSEQDAGVSVSEGASLVVDLSNVEEAGGFEAIPKGTYDVICADCEFTFSQSSGNPMWTLQWEIEDGEYAGRKLFTHWVWAGKGLPFTKAAVTAVAPHLLQGPFDPSDDEYVEGMLGVRARAKVVIKKYEGENRNNVSALLAPLGKEDFGS